MAHLERQTSDVRASAAATQTLVQVVHADLQGIKSEIAKFSELAGKSKGAVWVFLGVASLLGGIIAAGIKKILGI
jgi:hypothetical protein